VWIWLYNDLVVECVLLVLLGIDGVMWGMCYDDDMVGVVMGGICIYSFIVLWLGMFLYEVGYMVNGMC